MPLLRYRTGDIIRQTPTGYTLLGRRDSLYFTEDNTLVSPTEIDTALPDDGTFTCWHYILTQTAPTRWDFHYVADHNAPDTIAQNLAALLGTSTRVNLFRHRSIPPSPSGKFALLKPLPKNTAN